MSYFFILAGLPLYEYTSMDGLRDMVRLFFVKGNGGHKYVLNILAGLFLFIRSFLRLVSIGLVFVFSFFDWWIWVYGSLENYFFFLFPPLVLVWTIGWTNNPQSKYKKTSSFIYIPYLIFLSLLLLLWRQLIIRNQKI